MRKTTMNQNVFHLIHQLIMHTKPSTDGISYDNVTIILLQPVSRRHRHGAAKCLNLVSYKLQ